MFARGEVCAKRDEDRRREQHQDAAAGHRAAGRAAGEREIRFHGILRQVGGFHLWGAWCGRGRAAGFEVLNAV
jgi:hypothetical protein